MRSKILNFIIYRFKLTFVLLFFVVNGFGFEVGVSNALGASAVYYVDFTLGNDSNPGTEAAPWKSISKVNGTSVGAGDTVLFKRGEVWSEHIYPKSGTLGNPTIYSAYGTGDKPAMSGVIANNKSFISISSLYLSNNSNYQPLKIWNNSSHIIVDDCEIIGGVTNSSSSAAYISNSTDIVIKYSKIQHQNLNISTDALQMRDQTSYCLVEQNTIGTATHYALSMAASNDVDTNATGQHNIIKNNTIYNPEGAQVEVMSDSKYNLFDGNVISGGKSTALCSYLPRSFKLVTEGNILRRNIIKDNLEATGSGLSSEVYAYNNYPPNIAFNNRVYNNVISNILHYPFVIATNNDAGTAVHDNYYKNNAIYGNGFIYDIFIQNHRWIYDNYFENNVVYHDGTSDIIFNGSQGQTSIDKVEITDPDHWFGNIINNPLLDETFYPQIQSPVIDVAAALTVITSATGAGTSFTVADSRYFCDGWGIVTGDAIHVGDYTTIITSVDYSANLITVSAPISWSQGMGVSQPFDGAAMDIGAKERKLTYNISSVAEAGGSISPAGTSTANYGSSLTYTITPDTGYGIADVIVDGASVGAISSYTFSNVTANHTITATFAVENTNTITASAGGGGLISPAGTSTVNYGASLTYTITPDTGYGIADVTVDGASVGALSTYTFNNVTTNHTISATFTISTRTITASAGVGGSISPTGTSTVNYDSSLTYTITPDTGYGIADVIVDGASVGAISSYTFNNVTANHTITATFAVENTHTITASAGAGGLISPTGTSTVNYGASLTYTITPDTGYGIADVTVDGASVGALSIYTFSNVTTNHTISATFTISTRTIAASAGVGGSISPAGTSTVNYGASLTYTITPDTGYGIADVTVDGASVGAPSTYTFSNVTISHTISATFTTSTRTITASAGVGGSISPTGTSTVNYGASLTYTITPDTGYGIADVTVDGASVGALSIYTFSNVTTNHTISATFAVATVADLAITKTSDQSVYAPSSQIIYTITVTNYGPAVANSVVVTDNLPAHATFQTTTGNCTVTTKKLTCSLGTLQVGQSTSFQITESIQKWRGTITNQATVTSSTTDNNATNNSSSRVVTIR